MQRGVPFEVFHHLTFYPFLDSKMKPMPGRINHAQELQLLLRTKQKYSREDSGERVCAFALRVISLQTWLGGKLTALEQI